MMNLKVLWFLLLGMVVLCSAAGGGGVVANDNEDVLAGLGQKNAKRVQEGDNLYLECASENKEATFEWLKNNVEMVENDRVKPLANGTLIITSLTKEDMATYKCKDSDMEEKEYIVYMLSINTLMKSRTVVENEKLNITCQARGTPTPKISWKRDEVPLHGNDHIQILTIEGADDVPKNSTILIEEVQFDDRGHYTCIIDYGVGEFNTTTNIRVKGLYAALWPFLGIVAEVLVLCCIIFFFERRRSNAEYEESDTDTGKNGN